MSRKNKKKIFDKVYSRKYPSWDYGYFLKVQYDHLEKMHKFFKSGKTYSLEAPKVAKEILKAMTILKRVIADDYILFYKWEEADKNRKKDLQEYNKIIENNLWGWWD